MNLDHLIQSFQPIALNEMDSVQLMQRTDTKYVFNQELLIPLLSNLSSHYKLLEVNGVRSNRYKTLYYDTTDFKFYLQHQNGKMNRNKVRFRKYVDSDLCFLEIKLKNNKGETVKKRIKVDDFHTSFTAEDKLFVEDNTDLNEKLEPKLWNSFNRLTFVSIKLKERFTIDYNLQFEFGSEKIELPHVAIAELKQQRIDRLSPFAESAKKLKIRPTRMSKYCIGSALINESLKYNNFKPKIRTIKKITNDRVS
jgi:hypothetical protein